MGDMGAVRPGIFGECAVAFVPSSRLTPKAIAEHSSVLKDHGAVICEPRGDGSLPLEAVTHIISNTIEFPQFADSQAVMIPVVTLDWVTSSLGRRKTAPPRPFSPDPRMIFAQVTVSCADLPQNDKEGIIGATMALGGQESKDVGRPTTHICALSMDHPKVLAAQAKGWKGKIVLPHWFQDCFKLGKRIDETPYMLPDPEILRVSPEEGVEDRALDAMEGASDTKPTYHPPKPSDRETRPTATILQRRNVMLSKDLSIDSRLAKILQRIISDGGGKVVTNVNDCDMFICQYRDGGDYVHAAQSCKDVGNLAWFYHLITTNEWSSPFRRLLHYPVPKNGIPGFAKLRITVSNYGGEARIYLENLIKACGAEFTRTMNESNTHLITAHNSSEKCKAAPEWGIHVVNHLWIEECYAKCELKPINIEKYNHFPPRTHLGEIIGQVFHDESRLHELYYPGGEETMSPPAKKRRKILDAVKDNAYKSGPAEGVVIGHADQDEGFEVMRDEEKPKRKSSRSSVVTPARTRHAPSGKENDTPSVSGSRSAKAKAREMLQYIAPDIALYDKEKKRQSKTGSSPWGGKRATDMAEKESAKTASAKKTRKADEEEEEEEANRPKKRARPSVPEVEMRVIATLYEPWTENQKREDSDRKKLRSLGILLVEADQPCDFVCAPKIIRTVKFMCGLARGADIVSTAFIDAALESNELPDPDDFKLKDPKNERMLDVSLPLSVRRAKQHRGKLLAGVAIYCTENIDNGPSSFGNVAQANGAIFKVFGPNSASTIRPTTAEEDGGAAPDPVYLLSTNKPAERALHARFREMAETGHMEPRIVAPDWLLDVAMAQQVRLNPDFLFEAFFTEGKRKQYSTV